MDRREFLVRSAGVAAAGGLGAVAAQPAGAADEVRDELGFVPRVFTDAAGKKLPYRLFLPHDLKADQEYPLVLFLHGAGERGVGNDLQFKHKSCAVWATEAVQKKSPCLVVAPQCPEDDKWTGVERWDIPVYRQPAKPTEALRMTMELVGALRKEYRVGALYATGLSMGGYGIWELLNRQPEWWSGAVAICGGADETLAPKVRAPVWAFHGAQDTVVLPEQSRRMTDALIKLGRRIKYTEYPGVGHNSWDKAFGEPDLPEWLFAQRKG